MKKLILTIAVALSSLTLVGQTSQTNEPTVEFDVNRNLYVVYTDANNYYHVSEDGVLNGTFKFEANGVIISGNMVNGKRHGTMVEIVNGKETSSVLYDMGKAVAITRRLD